ncbi:MAG: cation-translocating P-type ATPase, partial [Chloroflexi bacterium]|nr:cation-translocating P-type ATPase [Chloroflexota bacterium]
MVEAGLRIPADARVLEAANLRVEEAALTGESVPVDKTSVVVLGEDLPLGDRRNMLYMGTTAVYGRATAVVVETGMKTELGHIAHLLQEVGEEKTPLQRRMGELGKWLALGALIICGVVFAVGVWRGGELTTMFLTAVSLAVAAVPEGLPAVVTIALALGAQRMVRRKALIRKLPAVETLGSVTTICSDKTGTLTENRMTVTMLDVAGESVDLVTMMRSTGAVLSPNEEPLAKPKPSIAMLLAGGALCTDASLQPDENGSGGYQAFGDPTEAALVVAAARMGLWKDRMEALMPRVAEAPFSSERKRMTTVHRVPDPVDCAADEVAECLPMYLPRAAYVAFTKGATSSVLAVCDRVWDEGRVEPLDAAWRQRIEAADDRLAQNGMRVLSVAMRPLDKLPASSNEDDLEQALVFVGLTGMIDPPRPEVREAVAEARSAGIRPVMITGDHPLTALTIARTLGIVAEDDEAPRIVTGRELSSMSVEELEGLVEEVPVYARVSPEHKVKIVEALKERGHFVAMTGDGVNDAPALKRADIGVAMGITGTDVSKEASDMVLLDDNFATIVNAIEEGRTIYENIRKFVKYIISSNVGEISLMLMAPLLGWPMPLTAVQLLWINLVTDGLPGLALGVEPADPSVMKRPPHPPDESVLARGLGRYILWVGLLLGAVCLSAQWIFSHTVEDARVWQTVVFTTLGLSQMGNALAVRSDRESLFRLGLLSNKPLLGAVVLTILLQLAVIYVPFLQHIFETAPLSAGQLGVCALLSG